jgi:hypothetical protein
MQSNNTFKPTASKCNSKKKRNLGIPTLKLDLLLKHLSKNYKYLNAAIITFGFIMSIILLGIANYFNSFNMRISFIPLMVSFILSSLLTALKYRFKKI